MTGAVILLVGIALAQFTLVEYFGGNTTAPTFASPQTLIIATATLLTVVLLSGFGRGALRSYAFLWGLLVGDAVSAIFGRLTFASAAAAPWLGIPKLLPYGALQFNAGVTAALLFAFVVATIEAMGVYYAAGEIVQTPITNRRINLGMAGEAAGSMISAVFGGFATTAYAQNVGLLKLTGVGSRHPVTVAGALFLVLAFLPKLGAALVATPDPVVGGIFLPAAASLIYTGVVALARTPDTSRHIAVGGLAVMLGTRLCASSDEKSFSVCAGQAATNKALRSSLLTAGLSRYSTGKLLPAGAISTLGIAGYPLTHSRACYLSLRWSRRTAATGSTICV